ncbi:MAG: MATE family efflux transporter, partial [Alphaproteobacteria bacterium]
IMVLFGMIAFAVDGYALAVEALVGEAIGSKDKQMLHIVVRRTNVMAGGSSLLISLVVLVGATPILMALTNQTELIELTLQHWHWVVIIPIASFLAFQMDGVFIGATRGRDMRNAMFVAALVFGLVVWLARPYGLAGLLGAFTLYLAMRGVTLWLLMPRVYRLVDQHS